MNFVSNKLKMVQIIISFLMVRNVSVDGCSIPSKYFEKEPLTDIIPRPITDTTEEPSINTSQKSAENTTKEQSSDSTDQTATINEVPIITDNTTEEQSSDITDQTATTNEVPAITENTIEEQSSDSTDQPATTNEVPTTDNNEEPSMSTQDSKYCSFPHCHVFKNGNLVLFPGKKSVIGYDDRRTFCSPFNGRIFVPRTEEDNNIWLEFTKMLYDEDNSFKEAWYPMDYAYAETETFYWLYDADRDEVNDSDYKLKIDDPNDGYRGRDHIFFSHDNENVFRQLQIRDGLEEAGFALCSAR
ncbi:UNVERIFIED_CONTAM: hypothetical protein RMT77_019675 [Armadillidium vulgare]